MSTLVIGFQIAVAVALAMMAVGCVGLAIFLLWLVRRRPLLALLAALLCWPTGPVRAAACGPKAAVLQALYEAAKESPAAIAIIDNGTALLEVLTAPGGATWTILVVRPDGTACVVAMGRDWQPLSDTGEPI